MKNEQNKIGWHTMTNWDVIRKYAENSYNNISFDPDKRAARDIKDLTDAENRFKQLCEQNGTPDLFEDWDKKLESLARAYWSANYGAASALVVGPANFNASRINKRNDAAHARQGELCDFIDADNMQRYFYRMRPDLKVKAENAERADSIIEDLKTDLAGGRVYNAGTPYEYRYRTSRALLAGRIRTLIRRNQRDTAKQVYELIKDGGVFAKNNSIFADIEKYLAAPEPAASAAAEPQEINGVKIVENQELNRLQLFFAERTDADTYQKLRKNGFLWSPRNKCFQRQLTDNARRAVRVVLQ